MWVDPESSFSSGSYKDSHSAAPHARVTGPGYGRDGALPPE